MVVDANVEPPTLCCQVLKRSSFFDQAKPAAIMPHANASGVSTNQNISGIVVENNSRETKLAMAKLEMMGTVLPRIPCLNM